MLRFVERKKFKHIQAINEIHDVKWRKKTFVKIYIKAKARIKIQWKK